MESVALDSVEGDRRGFIALYEQCNGENWEDNINWLTDSPIGDWYGAETNTDGRLEQLRLTNNNLTGSLPPEIRNWGEVVSVNFAGNNLTGSLPQEIGDWTQVEEVHLQDNNLTGSLPQEIGSWTQVQYVYLQDNNLSGSLPPEIGSWTRLHRVVFVPTYPQDENLL